MHSHLAVEVTLFRAALHLVDDDRPHHAGDKEGSRAIDDDLQVQRRGHHRWSLFQGWVSVNRTLVGSGQGWSTRVLVP